jgi:hypothetical protein
MLSEMIRMRVRSKSAIYHLLTADQRALVAREFHLEAEGRF